MRIYLNPSNIDFQRALNSEIYVDKSNLVIVYEQKNIYRATIYLCQQTETIWQIYGGEYADSVLQQRLQFKGNVQWSENCGLQRF